MTFLELQTRTLKRLDEDTAAPVTYTLADVKAALNEGYLFFVLLTLCLEKTVSYTVQAATTFQHALTDQADFLAPLRVRAGAAKVRPATLADLDALDPAWKAATGSVSRYGCLGFDLLFFYKRLAAPGTVELTYAYSPAEMAADGDVPAIPGEYHPVLPQYAVYRVRESLGAEELVRGLGDLETFLLDAGQLARQVRARSIALGYDKLPFELEKFDLSRLLAVRKDLLPARKEQPAWQSR